MDEGNAARFGFKRIATFTLRVAMLLGLVCLVGVSGNQSASEPQITSYMLSEAGNDLTHMAGMAAPDSLVTIYYRQQGFAEGSLNPTSTDKFRKCALGAIRLLAQVRADSSGIWQVNEEDFRATLQVYPNDVSPDGCAGGLITEFWTNRVDKPTPEIRFLDVTKHPHKDDDQEAWIEGSVALADWGVAGIMDGPDDKNETEPSRQFGIDVDENKVTLCPPDCGYNIITWKKFPSSSANVYLSPGITVHDGTPGIQLIAYDAEFLQVRGIIAAFHHDGGAVIATTYFDRPRPGGIFRVDVVGINLDRVFDYCDDKLAFDGIF